MSKMIKSAIGVRNAVLKYNEFVAESVVFDATSAAVVEADGKKIIPAGTIWPANDATAKGVILNDVDVTYGNENGALVTHGYINKNKLPAAPSAAAETALKLIAFS